MKFIVSKTALEMAVKNICRVINRKNALSILRDILCMVDEERKTITMTGSDSEEWLTYQVALADCEGGGSFCIGADLLRNALVELTEQPLTILATTESNNRFTLMHESGTTALPLELSDEYPTPRHLDSTVNEWTLESGMLKRVLKRSTFAMSSNPFHEVMNSVYFDQCDGVLNVVASNGHMLIHNAEDVDNLSGSFIMPKKAVKLLLALMDGDDEVVMVFDDRAVRVEQGLMSFTFLMIEGKYPNYMKVIPQDVPYHLTADRKALMKALCNVAHFTNDRSRLVKLTALGNQTMELGGEDIGFSIAATDRIDIDYPAGRDMTISVNADSIIDELSHIAERTVTIGFTNPSSAIIITPDDPLYQGEKITMLLMPLLTDE